MEQLDKILPVLKMLTEKSPDEFTEDELALVTILFEALPLLEQARLLLGNNLIHQATKFYLHIEEQAKAGNEEARKVYESLRPSYLAALREDLDSKESQN